MRHSTLAASIVAMLAIPAFAQQPQVKPPIAVYWMSVETAGGMGMGMPPGMGAFMPSGMQGGKRMKLDLGSSQSATGDPRASHAIPPGVSMGDKLPLVTPPAERAVAPERTEDEPQQYERPKGRMLIYWGCGEAVRSGQPVVVDFARLDAQEAARAFRSRNVKRPRGPAQGRNRTYGEWPNRDNSQAVPAGASLRGEHVVAGNYSPDIRFSVDERHDFMAPVAFDPVRKTAEGAFLVQWKTVPTAIGYFAMAMGRGENENDVVMWSSSEVQEMGHALMDYLPPAEVQRLIREKVLMPQTTSQCAVPAGVFKGEGAMLNFIAYGDELNAVYPPRPSDPKQVWEQQWAVKLRLKSTAMTMLAEGEGGMPRGRAASRRQNAESASAPAPAVGDSAAPAQAPQPPAGGEVLQEGIKALRGIFGR